MGSAEPVCRGAPCGSANELAGLEHRSDGQQPEIYPGLGGAN